LVGPECRKVINVEGMINILDRTKLFEILSKLKPDDKPAFGAMTAQHMVEHLAFTVRFSNGKEPQQHHYRAEKEQKIKTFIIDSDNNMPIGFKSPVLPAEGLPILKYPELSNAIDNLRTELNDFDNYFVQHPFDKPVNPTMGELNYKEWIRFHNRHFTHHFSQFRLLENGMIIT
jgi:hypothetical protein